MQRHEISRLAHAHHPVMAPLSDASVARLLERLDVAVSGRVLDLGCGSGEWLRRVLAGRDDLSGVGVDLHLGADPAAFASEHGGRARLEESDATVWSGGRFDAVLAVGVSHVFGGPGGTLDAVRAHLAPGGRVLLGDGIWDTAPTPAALDALDTTADEFPGLAGLVALAADHGYEVVHGHVSTLEEWDEYEWSWTGSLTDWALAPGRPVADRAQALESAQSHRDAWLGGYRGVLGFATLVLLDARGPAVS